MGLQWLALLLLHRVELHEALGEGRPAEARQAQAGGACRPQGALRDQARELAVIRVTYKGQGYHTTQHNHHPAQGDQPAGLCTHLSGAPAVMPISTHHFASGLTR